MRGSQGGRGWKPALDDFQPGLRIREGLECCGGPSPLEESPDRRIPPCPVGYLVVPRFQQFGKPSCPRWAMILARFDVGGFMQEHH